MTISIILTRERGRKALNERASGAKGAAYSTNSCQPHNERRRKTNLILQPERLTCIDGLPSHGKRSIVTPHPHTPPKKQNKTKQCDEVMSPLHWSTEP